MIPIITAILTAIIALPIGWLLGRGAGRRPFEDSLGSLARRLQGGELADVSGGPEPVRAVAKAVKDAWVPSTFTAAPGEKPEKRGGRKGRDASSAPERKVTSPNTGNNAAQKRDGAEVSDGIKRAALWEALHRVSNHLTTTVQRPLADASTGDATQLRDGVAHALGALEDIDFFLGTPPEGTTEIDLGETVREVIADFGATSNASPKQRGPRRPITVIGNPDALKDALFLVLHNAEQFGEGRAIDVVVRVQDGHGRVHVRDRGKGFSAEALSKAYDPFYTTVDGNLGLGLAHARQLIEDAGGKIHLLNSERGGGEVEIGLPLTS